MLLWACSGALPSGDSGQPGAGDPQDTAVENPDLMLFWGQVGDGRSLDGQCGPDSSSSSWQRNVRWDPEGQAEVELRCSEGDDHVSLFLQQPKVGAYVGKLVSARATLTWEGPEGHQPGVLVWRRAADFEQVERLPGGDLRLAGDIDLEGAQRHLHSSFELVVPCVDGCSDG
jgi:hypothetical protein